MPTALDLVDQLNAFADAESVKEFLKLFGVKGYRQDEESCPISNWISKQTHCFVITTDTIKVFHSGLEWAEDPEFDEFETSTVLKSFITNFDLGHYPELDFEDEDTSD